jgi:hypothetical protein
LDLKGDESETNFDGFKIKLSVSPIVFKLLSVTLFKELSGQKLKQSILQNLIIEGNFIYLFLEGEPIFENDNILY